MVCSFGRWSFGCVFWHQLVHHGRQNLLDFFVGANLCDGFWGLNMGRAKMVLRVYASIRWTVEMGCDGGCG